MMWWKVLLIVIVFGIVTDYGRRQADHSWNRKDMGSFIYWIVWIVFLFGFIFKFCWTWILARVVG